MKLAAHHITPCLWFDTEAEDAANHYVAIFENAKLGAVSRFGREGKEIHGKDAGTVMTVEFEIAGQKFLALNGGPLFKFNESVSFQVHCESQAEIDYFWNKLSEGGSESRCGWLRDKFGLSWQVVPLALPQLLRHADQAKTDRVMKAMLQMDKIDIAALQQAVA